MSNLQSRIEKIERRSDGCPCQTPRRIEFVEAEIDRTEPIRGGCASCGRPLPITEIVAVRPQDDTVC
jgi:hypothetical protein